MPSTLSPAEARSKRALVIALPIVKRLKADRARWEEEARADNARGYRAHYCEHGVNMWTDYDPICGACESGQTLYELALGEAHTIVWEQDRRVAVAMPVLKENSLPSDLRMALVDWALSDR